MPLTFGCFFPPEVTRSSFPGSTISPCTAAALSSFPFPRPSRDAACLSSLRTHPVGITTATTLTDGQRTDGRRRCCRGRRLPPLSPCSSLPTRPVAGRRSRLPMRRARSLAAFERARHAFLRLLPWERWLSHRCPMPGPRSSPFIFRSHLNESKY